MNICTSPARIIPAKIIPLENNYTNPLNYNELQKPSNIFEYEYWLPVQVPDVQPYYYISTYGRIFSTKYNKFHKCSINGHGYQEVSLRTIHNKRVQYRLHRLVMMTFNPIQNMDDYMVNHKDGIKTHNWIWNLEWCDNSYNINEAIIYGLKPAVSGEDHGMAKISNQEAEMVCELLKTQQYTHHEIVYIVGGEVTPGIVQQISTGRTHRNLYNKYGLGNIEKQVCKAFTNDQLHKICKYFQDHKDDEFKSAYDLYTHALYETGIVFDPDKHRGYMANIRYKKQYNSICDLYDY